MMMNSLIISITVLLSLFGANAHAQNKGPVTPTSVTYTFNSAQLTTVNGENYGLFQTPVPYTFRKSDPDFANATITDITIAYGRYKSIGLCFNTNVSMTIHGEVYRGQTGSIANGATIYGQANGTVSTSNPGSPQTLTVSISSSAQNCTTTYFRNPLCVTASGTTGCQTGDEIYTAAGKINPNTGELDLGSGAAVQLQISFLMDMLHGVIINADNGAVTTAPPVKVTLGKPGAAVHLGKWNGSGATDVSLIFSNDKTLLSAVSSEYPGSHSVGFCGSPQTPGINFITFFDDATGKVAYPATAACPDSSNCSPSGFNVFTNVIQSIGNTTSVSCVDSADVSVPQFLKEYTYQGGVGSGEIGTQTFAIQRIVDPTNLFGVCTAMSTGAVSGKPGVCAFAGSDADGY